MNNNILGQCILSICPFQNFVKPFFVAKASANFWKFWWFLKDFLMFFIHLIVNYHAKWPRNHVNTLFFWKNILFLFLKEVYKILEWIYGQNEPQHFRQYSQSSLTTVFGKARKVFLNSTFQSWLDFVPFNLVTEWNSSLKMNFGVTHNVPSCSKEQRV